MMTVGFWLWFRCVIVNPAKAAGVRQESRSGWQLRYVWNILPDFIFTPTLSILIATSMPTPPTLLLPR